MGSPETENYFNGEYDCESNALPTIETAGDILKQFLLLNNYDGLWNPDVPCGCLITDLVPCDGPCHECKPGYRREYKASDRCGCDAEGIDHWHVGGNPTKRVGDP